MTEPQSEKPQVVPMPAPLDPTRLHHPRDVRAYKQAVDAHFASVRAVEAHEQRERQEAQARARAPLSEDAYFDLRLAQHNEQQRRQLEREAASLAKHHEREAYLASDADSIEVMENNAMSFLTTVEHFARKGYTLDLEGPLALLPPSLWHVRMNRLPQRARKELH